jgi:molybdate transport system substrate-binding protein
MRFTIASLLALLSLTACTQLPAPAPPRELHVMTSGGYTEAYRLLAPRFETATGTRLVTTYGASTGGAPDSIPERLKRGERADVVIMARENLDQLVASGLVRPADRTDLVRSRIGMAVRAGADLPDISTPDAFVATVRAAPTLAYSASASGTYLATTLFPKLGIWEELQPRARRVVSERVGSVVARGDAAIGFQQISELLPIAGISVVGPIPEPYQKVTVFSAGISSRTDSVTDARRLIRFLAQPSHAPAVAATGLDPVSADQ